MQLLEKHKTILIIDDNQDLRIIILEALRLEGYTVMDASDGFIGIEMAKKYRPDLILCDVIMPGIDGFEVKKQLGNNIETLLIPFIFLTAIAEQNEVRKGMRTGADDYLLKPVVLDELLLTIETRLKKYESINTTVNEKIDKFKNRIVSILPHELLTPLNGILGFACLIRDDIDSFSRKEIAELASAIEKSGNRLHHLINNYLKYSILKINKEATFVKTSLRTNEIITNTSQQVALIYDRPNDIKLDLACTNFMIDKDDFEYVLNEIIDNAFKFSKTDTLVEIESKTDGDNFIIKITDKGIGFPMKNLNDIGAFNQFNRAELEQQGFGLGLIISKLIVQRYNGKLKINRVKNGTEVRIILPV
jgi:two-component system, sensor histidine kinase and response regulator